MSRTILMVQPDHFGFNEETSGSNSFQKKSDAENILSDSKREFENAVEVLQKNGINVLTFPSPANQKCPDAVFPNNWFSTHENGTLIIYPMLTANRRAERNPIIIDVLKEKYDIKNIIDLSKCESENKILEGTGSIVFDHEMKWAYACISPRTNETLLNEVCRKLHYTPIVFEASDLNGKPVYHTNVVMAIAKKYVVICLDSIENILEKSILREKIKESGKKLIEISIQQMNHFCGNMLELENHEGKSIIVMSQTAFETLNSTQKEELSQYSQLLPISIPTIETIGGGSARCMIAEIHFTQKIP